MKRKIKFLIIDDQKIIREGLSEKLRSLFEKTEIRELASGKDSPDVVRQFEPDIIFMDISMPDMDGIETTRLILSQFPGQNIIAFSMNDNDETLNKMMDAGVRGYLLKTDDETDFLAAVDTVLSGHFFVSKSIKGK